MNEFFHEALIGCLGAFISAVFSYRSSQSKDSVDREDVYANHTSMLWDKIDKQSETIDALTKQVEELRTENARLVRQVTELTAQVKRLSRGARK